MSLSSRILAAFRAWKKNTVLRQGANSLRSYQHPSAKVVRDKISEGVTRRYARDAEKVQNWGKTRLDIIRQCEALEDEIGRIRVDTKLFREKNAALDKLYKDLAFIDSFLPKTFPHVRFGKHEFYTKGAARHVARRVAIDQALIAVGIPKTKKNAPIYVGVRKLVQFKPIFPSLRPATPQVLTLAQKRASRALAIELLKRHMPARKAGDFYDAYVDILRSVVPY